MKAPMFASLLCMMFMAVLTAMRNDFGWSLMFFGFAVVNMALLIQLERD